TKLVQQAEITLPLDGDELLGEYSTFEPAPGVRGVVVALSSRDENLGSLRQLLRYIAGVTGIVVVLAVVAASWLARRLAHPVEQLVEGTQRLAKRHFLHNIQIRHR